MQLRLLLFDLLPDLLKRFVVGRIARQLSDRQACLLLGKEGLRGFARVVARTVLQQHQALGRLREDARQEGDVGRRVEPSFLALIKEAPRAVIQQPEDLVAFAHATGRHWRWLSLAPPGGAPRAPLRQARFSAKQQQRSLLARQAHGCGPSVTPPLPAFFLVQMGGNKSRLLPREAQVFEQRRAVKHTVVDAEACQDQGLHER